MLKRMSFALIGAAMVMQACATSSASSYRHIADPEQIFAAADWTADVEAAVNAAGWADRKPEIMADAAYFILTQPSTQTGNFHIDDEVLAAQGITDLDKYSVKPGTKKFIPDFFVD